MTIDLTGSNKATKGAVNCGFAQTIAAARVAFKELVNPDAPIGGGNFRNLDAVSYTHLRDSMRSSRGKAPSVLLSPPEALEMSWSCLLYTSRCV